jgi:hypothetical protein
VFSRKKILCTANNQKVWNNLLLHKKYLYQSAVQGGSEGIDYFDFVTFFHETHVKLHSRELEYFE